MNSDHEQCTKMCTAPGQVVCTARTRHAQLIAQCPGCAHVPRTACAGRVHSVQIVRASRDFLPSPSPRLGCDIISRSRLTGRLSQVATSIPCRDLPFAQQKHIRSRPQNGVSTPISNVSSCDTKSRSPAQPGRDANFWSRPQAGQSRL